MKDLRNETMLQTFCLIKLLQILLEMTKNYEYQFVNIKYYAINWLMLSFDDFINS